MYENPQGRKYFAPRHYTVTSKPDADFIRITVKCEGAPKDHPDAPAGIVSTYLMGLKEGDIVKMGPCFGPDPVGEAQQHRQGQGSAASAALVSVGIGITFSASILDRVSKEYQSVHVFHADANADTHALRQAMEEQSKGQSVSFHYYYSHCKDQTEQPHVHKERLTAEKVFQQLQASGVNNITKDVDFYVCGTPEFSNSIMKGMTDLGVARQQLRMEFFGPFVSLPLSS